MLCYNADSQMSIIEKQHVIQSQFEQQESDDFGADVIRRLRSMLSPERLNRCDMVLEHRTDRILLVLDQCYDVRNQCAMLRTAELFGVQNVWIVKPINYKNMKVYDSISRRSQFWLTLRFFNSSTECVNALRLEETERKIWVTDLGKDAMELSLGKMSEIELPKYLAIVMGKEAEGPSDAFLEAADQKVYLPQFGFCESFNVSVACALTLQCLFSMNEGMRGQMDQKQKQKLKYLWYYQLINDEKIKKDLKQLMMHQNEIEEEKENENKTSVDFRRNEFKHWDSKKINFRLRKKLLQRKNEKYLHSINTDKME